jgi:DNA-binding transcriptional regulator YhcF (GntR family)
MTMNDISVRVNKKISIPIHEQIYMQLKNQILVGDLPGGTRLPSVRQLSDLIKVNRHTISRAYDSLEAEGLVEIFASSGTFVRQHIKLPRLRQTELLTDLIDDVMKQADAMGFTPGEVALLTFVASMKTSSGRRRGLFVECNPYAISQYVEDIERETALDVDGWLLDDERLLNGDCIEEYDVIMTTMGHYAELKKKLKRDNIYALNFGPYLSVVNQIRQLERTVIITIVCVTANGSEGLKEVLIDLGIAGNKLHATHLDDAERLDELINSADVLVVSKYALMQDRERFERTGKFIIEYKNTLQSTSIHMLKQIISMLDAPSRTGQVPDSENSATEKALARKRQVSDDSRS